MGMAVVRFLRSVHTNGTVPISLPASKGGARVMNHRGKSFLGGAAVAALLILPAAAANGDWTVWPTKTFSANSLKLRDVVGTLTVDVRDGGPVTVDVSGARPRVNGVSIHQEDGTVVIDGSSSSDNESVWDWHKWFNFSTDWAPKIDNLRIKVTVPRAGERAVASRNRRIGEGRCWTDQRRACGDRRIRRCAVRRDCGRAVGGHRWLR
jgi:hypothetical protein